MQLLSTSLKKSKLEISQRQNNKETVRKAGLPPPYSLTHHSLGVKGLLLLATLIILIEKQETNDYKRGGKNK